MSASRCLAFSQVPLSDHDGQRRYPLVCRAILLGGLQQIELPPLLLRHDRKVEDLLQIGGVAEGRVVLLSGSDGFRKALIVGQNSRDLDVAPGGGLDILAEAAAQFGTVRAMDDLKAALFAIDAKFQ